jgi:hypothetical protein
MMISSPWLARCTSSQKRLRASNMPSEAVSPITPPVNGHITWPLTVSLDLHGVYLPGDGIGGSVK